MVWVWTCRAPTCNDQAGELPNSSPCGKPGPAPPGLVDQVMTAITGLE